MHEVLITDLEDLSIKSHQHFQMIANTKLMILIEYIVAIIMYIILIFQEKDMYYNQHKM